LMSTGCKSSHNGFLDVSRRYFCRRQRFNTRGRYL